MVQLKNKIVIFPDDFIFCSDYMFDKSSLNSIDKDFGVICLELKQEPMIFKDNLQIKLASIQLWLLQIAIFNGETSQSCYCRFFVRNISPCT